MATILLIDDSETERQYLQLVFRHAGHNVAEAKNGHDALALMSTLIPDLVVTDLIMPGMDGFEFIRRIQREPETRNTPVVIYTGAYDDSGTRAFAAEFTTATILPKPSEPEVVLRTIERVLGESPTETNTSRNDFEKAHLALVTTSLYQKTEDLKQANVRLAQNERLQLALEAGNVGIWEVYPPTHEIYWDERCKAAFGVSLDAVVDEETIDAALHPDDREGTWQAVKAAQDPAGSGEFSAEHRTVGASDGALRYVQARGKVLFGMTGNGYKAIRVVGTMQDITQRKQSEDALRTANEHLSAEIAQRERAEQARQESDELFRTLADTVPQLIWICNPDGMNIYFNQRWVEYTGLTLEESYGTGWNTPFHPDDKEHAWHAWSEAIQTGGKYRVDCRLRRHDGSYHWFLTKGVPLRDATGRIAKWFGTCTDIDDLKRAEEEHRRSLLEKETLLKEIHHRVKNNLQVISSLLRLQGDSVTDPGAAAALKDSRQRVSSMALIHERLYGNKQMDEIDFGEYTQTIISELLYSFASEAGNLTSRVDVSGVRLGIDQAIPCGLILNELVTNALKYAYQDGGGGEVAVELKEPSEGHIKLTVSDHGVGLPEGFDWKNSETLGLRLVQVLADQLDGTLTVSSRPGATFSLEFPISRTKAAKAGSKH